MARMPFRRSWVAQEAREADEHFRMLHFKQKGS